MTELPLEIDCRSVHSRKQSGEEFILLDCREQEEFDIARIEGAKFIPMSELQSRVDELEQLKGQLMVVFCHHGGRSEMVTRWLRAQEFTVQSMAGGIDAWAAEIEPTMARY